jgi:hypothetical protein
MVLSLLLPRDKKEKLVRVSVGMQGVVIELGYRGLKTLYPANLSDLAETLAKSIISTVDGVERLY